LTRITSSTSDTSRARATPGSSASIASSGNSSGATVVGGLRTLRFAENYGRVPEAGVGEGVDGRDFFRGEGGEGEAGDEAVDGVFDVFAGVFGGVGGGACLFLFSSLTLTPEMRQCFFLTWRRVRVMVNKYSYVHHAMLR
jgi:hypothetical protein